MDHTVFMKFTQGPADLLHDYEPLVDVWDPGIHQLAKIAALDIIHHKIMYDFAQTGPVVANASFMDFDDVGMVDAVQEINLLVKTDYFLDPSGRAMQYFDRENSLFSNFLGPIDRAGAALGDFTDLFVFAIQDFHHLIEFRP
jgi:hypothetical protein